ncbi:hypothetical protein JCM10212_000086 [Sporobolomyces blumeae]
MSLHFSPTFAPAPPSSYSTASSSSSPSFSGQSPASIELPSPISYSALDLEMDHLFNEAIDSSLLDSRPTSPSALSAPLSDPFRTVGNFVYPESKPAPRSFPTPVSLAPPAPPPAHKAATEAKRQIDVLTTILTSPNLLPTALPSLPAAFARARSSSSTTPSSSRAKRDVLGTTSPRPHKSWLDALKDAETKAKAKKMAGSQTGLARL